MNYELDHNGEGEFILCHAYDVLVHLNMFVPESNICLALCCTWSIGSPWKFGPDCVLRTGVWQA